MNERREWLRCGALYCLIAVVGTTALADERVANSRSGTVTIKRTESPYLAEQLSDTGHNMPLYEAWMVELFCNKSVNRTSLRVNEASCSRAAITKLVRSCSAQLRMRVPKAYFEDTPERPRYSKFVKAYQRCMVEAASGGEKQRVGE